MFNAFHFPTTSLQAPTQDGLVSLSSRINSSPDSSETLSEIPLSYKGVPLVCHPEPGII